VGVSPTWVKARSPVAWMAGSRETEGLKPIDKAIFGIASESPGRNASEHIGGLEKSKVRRSSLLREGEDSMGSRRLAETAAHSGGVIVTARWQGRVEQLEKPSSSRREIGGAR